MNKWRELSIDELCIKVTDGSHFSPPGRQSGFPMVSVKDMRENGFDLSEAKVISETDYKKLVKSDCKPLKNDVLIAKDGSYLKHVFVCEEEKEIVILSSIAILRPNIDIINPIFLKYILKTPSIKRMMSNYVSGSALPRIILDAFKKMKLFIPPLQLQEKLADILSAYDELIENNNRRIELLEKAAQDIFKEWFGRMRFPGFGEMKFENGVPQGWENVRLADEINITSSKRVYLSDYVENGVLFYRSKEVIELAKGQAISEPIFIDKQKYLYFKNKFGAPVQNDILLTSVGTIGVSLLISNDKPFYFKDGNLTWLQTSTKPDFALYLYLWLNSESGKQQILSSIIGTSQSALTIENLKKNKIMKPNNKLLVEFAGLVRPIFNQKSNLQSQNHNLTKQRDLLLPWLMSGKLEI